MTDLSRKRKSIELRHLEEWLTYGPKRFLFRHENFLRPIIEYSLRAVGLFDRGRRNALRPVVREMTFQFDALPEEFCGFRILHLSDFHIDGLPGLAERVAEKVARLDADLCVFTGDYRFATSGPCHNIYPEMRKIIEAIRSRHGILGILGNHDYAEEATELEAMGVRMLMNESVEIQNSQDRIWVAGIDDAWDYDCADLQRALRGVPAGAFKILLAHSPDTIGEAAASGIHLYLCGHTHAGQIRLPFIGATMVPASCKRRFIQGRWKAGAMDGYTSSGIGCSLLPVRFLCPPEIALIELRRCHPGRGDDCRVHKAGESASNKYAGEPGTQPFARTIAGSTARKRR